MLVSKLFVKVYETLVQMGLPLAWLDRYGAGILRD